ncbi:33153_t:CDS:2 [Gigaspora margarita]|uniref:33153_t:CDS:1 n=1 Tax=Gigaspora margarita TaxID=4874 RepID=A0ABN7VCS9_GIGMA|nr:33153_t:CDS:2 [Gigaspora margarita]
MPSIAHPETVWLIRRLSEKVEWLKLKIGKNVSEEASSSINEREEEIRGNKKEKSKKNYNEKIDCLDLVENIQEIPDKKKCKEILLLTECGISNYGTKEVQKQLTENKVAGLAKHNNLTESIIRNVKQATVFDKMELVTTKKLYEQVYEDTKKKKSNSNSFQKNNRRMHISSPKSIHEETSGFVLKEILQRLDDIERRYIGD